MDLLSYFEKLNLSKYIIDTVLTLIKNKRDEYEKYTNDLTIKELSENQFLKIKEIYPDKYCFDILAIYLLASIKTYEKYKEVGIEDEIFYSTMKCISRFINECKVMNNEEYFDRDFWVHRQLSMKLFRLGELEYELIDSDTSISVHIPSDAILTKELIDESFNKLFNFIDRYYPKYKKCLIYCESWLLSVNLKKYLNDFSKILIFQSYFDIKKINQEDKSFIEWLFKTKSLDYTTYKTSTSLQRKVKEAIINGELIGSAYGICKLEWE